MDPKSAALMQLLSEKLKTGPDDQIIETPDGGRLRVQRAPEPGVTLVVEPLGAGAGLHSISWEAAATRPPRYPDDVPFVAGRVAMLTMMPKGFHLQVFKSSEGDLHALVAELVGSGWTETVLPTPTMPGMSIRPFRRGDRQRILVLGGDLLGLIDTPTE
jgi:hypothetical protein